MYGIEHFIFIMFIVLKIDTAPNFLDSTLPQRNLHLSN